MKTTSILSLIMMAALFLLLYAAVALIQDRRLFSTAPKDIQAAVEEHEERFPGQHLLGWLLGITAILTFVFAFIYAGYDGLKNGYSFGQLVSRYLVLLYGMKAFDIIFFDWFLLTRSHFFQHYYPETEGCQGYHSFGYNRREQITEMLFYPFLALACAGICALFR